MLEYVFKLLEKSMFKIKHTVVKSAFTKGED